MRRFLYSVAALVVTSMILAGCGGGMTGSGISGSSDGNSLINGTSTVPGAGGGTGVRSASGSEKVIITFKSQPGAREEGLVRGQGGQVRFTYRIVPAIAATLPAHAAEALKNNPNVLRVEPDVEIQASDAELDATWGVKKIGAGNVHATNTGAGVSVAILDSGTLYTHTDLDARFDPANPGWDFVNNDAQPLDDNGHGTHVSGSVAAEDNDTGVVGVAPGARLYSLKVLDRRGRGNFSHVIAALDWVVANKDALGIRVTSNSYGSASDPGQTVQDAFNNAAAAGILNVVAAGNSGTSDTTANNVNYPGRYASVLCVASVDSTDTRAGTSSTGPDVDIAAPGVSIYSTSKSGGYETKSGTSMATPHVAGLAALVFAAFPNATPDQVRSQIQSTAVDLGTAGRDNLYGYGRIDANKAATQAVLASVSPADGDSITPSGTGSTSVTVTGTATHITGESLTWGWTLDGATVLDDLGVPITAASFTRNLSDGPHTVQGTATSTSGATATVTSAFSVAEPPPPPAKALNVTVTTNKPTYANKNKVTITVSVKDENNAPVSGATVNVVIHTAAGGAPSGSATTGSTGVVTFGYTVNTATGGKGTYTVDATASKSGYPNGTASTTFLVQ